MMHDIARHPDATQMLIRVLNHEVRPSQLFTTPRAIRAAARALHAEPRRIVATVKEIVTAASQEVKHARQRRLMPPGMTTFDPENRTSERNQRPVHRR
ncbi:hypothetical protein [Candidatus Mycobacterium methanotrophicum]|uniref:DUF222 domain-containing protein n=1 Tax=Candidatus Mycobacterium methanotrophicum TaxID=2943498 RepID=A0ABY4QLR9_9MYCO|nr:hypothetical protein [Candidatus Mycobacterium methanotrophicum]UQX11447.1 hypothetical protein M5I08_02695 [Candidatus Mycobacterium methanotrophicum]